MSKYVDLVVKNAKEEGDVRIQAEELGSILGSKIEAQVKAQEAVIIERKIDLKQANSKVEAAQIARTRNVDAYLSGIKQAWVARDMAAEELQVAQDNYDKLTELAKLFA